MTDSEWTKDLDGPGAFLSLFRRQGAIEGHSCRAVLYATLGCQTSRADINRAPSSTFWTIQLEKLNKDRVRK